VLQIARSLVSLEFFIDTKSFWSHCSHGVDSNSNRNKYQEYFLGVKAAACLRLTTLPPSCAVFTKSGNLNFLETSGSVQACNGTALLFGYLRFCNIDSPPVYCLHNVSALNLSRKAPCDIFVSANTSSRFIEKHAQYLNTPQSNSASCDLQMGLNWHLKG